MSPALRRHSSDESKLHRSLKEAEPESQGDLPRPSHRKVVRTVQLAVEMAGAESARELKDGVAPVQPRLLLPSVQAAR